MGDTGEGRAQVLAMGTAGSEEARRPRDLASCSVTKATPAASRELSSPEEDLGIKGQEEALGRTMTSAPCVAGPAPPLPRPPRHAGTGAATQRLLYKALSAHGLTHSLLCGLAAPLLHGHRVYKTKRISPLALSVKAIC